jgi:hypothetical protein
LLPLAAAIALVVGARASQIPGKPFHASFIGENGSYTRPDAATDDYLRTPPARPAPAPVSTKPPAAAKPSAPAPAEIDAQRRHETARPAAMLRHASISAEAGPVLRASLWNGLVRPLDMTSSRAQNSAPDEARADAGRDYESHILGAASPELSPLLARAPGSASGASSGALRPSVNRIFVTVDIDPIEGGSLRDAVAALGATAGFSPDASWNEPPSSDAGVARVSGWMSASRLGVAATRAGVKRVQVESSAKPSAPGRTEGDFLIGLRVPDSTQAAQSAEAGIRALTRRAGFRLGRVVGLETAPDGRKVALVSGRLPIDGISAALALEQVAAVAPAGGDASQAPAPLLSGLTGFARFAARRGLWLIVLTLLLALKGLRDPAWRAAAVFNPYR